MNGVEKIYWGRMLMWLWLVWFVMVCFGCWGWLFWISIVGGRDVVIEFLGMGVMVCFGLG